MPGRCAASGRVLPLGNRLPSPSPCNYPHHQALRASFLPRWGKKPFRLAVFFGDSQPKAPSVRWATEGSACAVRTTPKALATRSRQPKQVQTTVSGLYAD